MRSIAPVRASLLVEALLAAATLFVLLVEESVLALLVLSGLEPLLLRSALLATDLRILVA